MNDWTSPPLPDPDAECFRRIAALVHRQTGIRLAAGKEYFVAGRLGGLLRALGCSDWRGLCEHLETSEAAGLPEGLIPAVVTGETRFFRDGAPFRALRDKLLPETAEAGNRAFRVWSAGCSTGQEPYSVAMALWDAAGEARIALEIRATDICEPSLRRAEEGVYDSAELGRGLEPEERRRFFDELPSGSARVRDDVRRAVQFGRFNLAAPGQAPPRTDFDAVLCRNVAIYFDGPGRRRLFALLGSALKPGGHLVLGAAETPLPRLGGFEPRRFGRCVLYRKTDQGRRGP